MNPQPSTSHQLLILQDLENGATGAFIKSMLRITVHEDGTFCRLELAGRLAGLWVAETQDAWIAAMQTGREIEVDMRQLTKVDDAGRELLQIMCLAGARLVVEGVWMKGIAEEISEANNIKRSIN